MIKKILPAMIGVALVGGMANAAADVTAMGHIDTAIIYQDEIPGGTDSGTNFVCTTCSFGFKGSEDLGNGLKAIFKLDFQYDTTERNNSTGLTDRDQWLGLKGDSWGQVRGGSISTSYKSHGAMIDPVYRTVVQGRDLGIQSVLQKGAGDAGQGRATNTFRYDSPTWGGFKGTAHYTLQSDDGIDPDTDNPWGIGGQWQGGGFLVFADYITSDAGGDDDAYKVGGRFGFSNFAVFGQYEVDGGLISTQGTTAQVGSPKPVAGSGDGADVWFIGGTAGFGNNLIYAAYSQGDDTDATLVGGGAIDSEYDAWEIVGVHSLSKRTKVYAGFAQVNPDADGSEDTDNWTLGMKHTF